MRNEPKHPKRRASSRLIHAAVFGWSLAAAAASATPSAGTPEQQTLSTSGGTPSGSSSEPSLASNGRILTFLSNASNLVTNDLQESTDLFVKDLLTGAVSLQSLTSGGSQANDASFSTSVSMVDPNGFYAVAFESYASNLGFIDDTNALTDIFVRLPTKSFTEAISKGVGNVPANGRSYDPSVAYIPKTNVVRIAFVSSASNLVSADGNDQDDVFLAEFTVPPAGKYDASSLVSIRRVSQSTAGVEGDGRSSAPKISANGQFVIFESEATNLLPVKLSAFNSQVYLYDIATGSLTLISKASDGTEGSGNSSAPSISYNGRYMTFLTTARNIVTLGVNERMGIVHFDSEANVYTRTDTTSSGTGGNADVQDAQVSSNGRFVCFSAKASNLVSGGTNGLANTYVKDISSGALLRMSTPTLAADNDSDSVQCNIAVDQSTQDVQTTFLSFSTVLDPNGHPSGNGDVYLVRSHFDPLPLNSGTELEAPPDVTVKNRKVTVNMQRFGKPDEVLSRATVTVNYEARFIPKKKSTPRTTIVSKRNRVTTRKLPPGTYTVRYRVVAKSGDKPVSKTPFSPGIKFKV